MNKVAKTKIKFAEVSQEAFEAFADELAEHTTEGTITFHEKTLLGLPYILCTFPDDFGTYNLIVEAGDYLCLGETENWVECDNCQEIRNKSLYGR